MAYHSPNRMMREVSNKRKLSPQKYRHKLIQLQENLRIRSYDTYAILLKHEWEGAVKILAESGSGILKDMEKLRATAHQTKVGTLSKYATVKELEKEFNEISKDFEFFFDAGMLWLRGIIEGGKYEDYQVFQKKNVESLISHCQKALEYLGNLISSKRNLFFTYKFLLISIIAVGVAVLSFAVSIYFGIVRQ